jgi:hypothetical protein
MNVQQKYWGFTSENGFCEICGIGIPVENPLPELIKDKRCRKCTDKFVEEFKRDKDRIERISDRNYFSKGFRYKYVYLANKNMSGEFYAINIYSKIQLSEFNICEKIESLSYKYSSKIDFPTIVLLKNDNE